MHSGTGGGLDYGFWSRLLRLPSQWRNQYTGIPVYQYTGIPIYRYTSIRVYWYTHPVRYLVWSSPVQSVSRYRDASTTVHKPYNRKASPQIGMLPLRFLQTNHRKASKNWDALTTAPWANSRKASWRPPSAVLAPSWRLEGGLRPPQN